MARREVMEITCDRCQKTETQPISNTPADTPELRVTFRGVTVEYADLCTRCRGGVSSSFKVMTKQKDEDEVKI